MVGNRSTIQHPRPQLPGTPGSLWAVVRSLPRAEELLVQALGALGLLAWVPLRHAQETLVPLFPRYVFASLGTPDAHPQDAAHALRSARYSAGPLASSPASPPSAVRWLDLRSLADRLEAGEFDHQPHHPSRAARPRTNTQVRVSLRSPILPSLEGWLEEIRGGRGVVRVGSRRVLVPMDQLSAA